MIPVESRSSTASSRQCGECTVCCEGVIAANIYGHEMKPGQPCHFFSGDHCTIYERRPTVCRNFICGWLAADSPFPDDFRPKELGVLIVRTDWRGRPAYILRSARRDPDETLLAWMREFSTRTGTPFFYEQRGQKFGFGPEEFQRDMLLRAQRGDPTW